MASSFISRRTLCFAFLVFSSVIVSLTFIRSLSFRQYVLYPGFGDALSRVYRCSPEAYAAGSWTRKPHPSPLINKEGVLAVSGFEGCASSREVGWHLGTSWDGEDEFKKLQWRGNASSYDWAPGEGCEEDYTKVAPETLVRQLVEEGGWLILGDSISEGHFFSLSCMLYPYVRATPDYTLDPWSFDRAWPQNLYLKPSSPIIPYLNLPEGFDVDTTPLVTFRRVDLLLGKSELNALYSSKYTSDRPLFSDEQTWDLDPSIYLPQFLAPLPQSNYRTMIISTAGHWTTTLFSGFHNHNDTEAEGNGLRDLLPFFGEAMNLWVTKISSALDEAKRIDEEKSRRLRYKHKQTKQKQVVVRAYVHGHDSCHLDNVELAGPLAEYQGLPRNWYNWSWIRRFNDVFEAVISQRASPNIHFLPIDRPALLRPDGHTQGDCLHLLTGAGILEGWSEYISYFVSRLP